MENTSYWNKRNEKKYKKYFNNKIYNSLRIHHTDSMKITLFQPEINITGDF